MRRLIRMIAAISSEPARLMLHQSVMAMKRTTKNPNRALLTKGCLKTVSGDGDGVSNSHLGTG